MFDPLSHNFLYFSYILCVQWLIRYLNKLLRSNQYRDKLELYYALCN